MGSCLVKSCAEEENNESASWEKASCCFSSVKKKRQRRKFDKKQRMLERRDDTCEHLMGENLVDLGNRRPSADQNSAQIRRNPELREEVEEDRAIPSGKIVSRRRLPRIFCLPSMNSRSTKTSRDFELSDLDFIRLPTSQSPLTARRKGFSRERQQQHLRSQQQSPLRHLGNIRSALNCSYNGYTQIFDDPSLCTLDLRQLSQWNRQFGTSLETAGGGRRTPTSPDLEWENAETLQPYPSVDPCDSVPSLSVNNDTMETCSVALSQHSIPPLDWDEQGEKADLVSLSNNDAEETELLISQIERLTSRALEETNKWNYDDQVENDRAVDSEDTGGGRVVICHNNNNSWQLQ